MIDENIQENANGNLEETRNFISTELAKMPHDKALMLGDLSSAVSNELLAAYLKVYPNSFVNARDVTLQGMRFKELAKSMALEVK